MAESDQTRWIKPLKDKICFVPSPVVGVERMLKLAKVKNTDVVCDLGCGVGNIVITAAKKFGCKAIGYEAHVERLKKLKENIKLEGVSDKVKIIEDDLFNADLSKFDVVTLFLERRLNIELIPQLQKMKPGSRIVTRCFRVPGFEYDAHECNVFEEYDNIYLYTLPLKPVKNACDCGC